MRKSDRNSSPSKAVYSNVGNSAPVIRIAFGFGHTSSDCLPTVASAKDEGTDGLPKSMMHSTFEGANGLVALEFPARTDTVSTAGGYDTTISLATTPRRSVSLPDWNVMEEMNRASPQL